MEIFFSIMLIFFSLSEFERTETSISNRYIMKTNFAFYLKFKRVIATYSGILAWEIPWTETFGGLQFMGSQKVR